MLVKDRFPELINIAGDKVYNDTTLQILLPNEIEDKICNVIKQITKIRMWINDINERTENMKKLYCEPTFQASQQMQEEMDTSMAICSANGSKICGALREFQEKLNKTDDEDLDIISRIIELQYYTTSKLYTETLSEHQNFLNKYKDSRMSILRKQMKLTNKSVTEEECEALLESNNISIFVDNIESETQEALLTLREVELRHKELLKIENALKDVKDMFGQLGSLVYRQQEKIDTVAYYASQATELVDGGNVQLNKGFQNKVKSKKKQISLIICLLVAFFIIILIMIAT